MNVIPPVDGTNNIRYADFVRVTTPDATYRFASTASALTVPAVDSQPFDALGVLIKVGDTQRDIKSTANESTFTLVGIDTAALGWVLGNQIKGSQIEAWKGFFDTNGALITTGIGALVVALGFAANAMGLFGDSSEDTEKQQKKLDDQLEKTNKRLEDQKNLTDSVSQTLDNRVRRELIDAKKRGASEAELNKIQKEGLKDRIRLLEQEEKANLKLYLQKSKSGSTKEYEAAEAAYKESAQNLIDARLTYDEMEADIAYNRIQENKKLREQDAKEQEFVFTGNVEAFDAAAIDIDTIDNQLYEDMKARDAADIERINADNQLKIDANAELQQALTDATLTRIAIEEEAEAEKQRKFKENLKTSLELSIQGLNLIASIAEMNAGEDKKRQKRAFNIKKAANIASATMDGYNAVLSTFADTKGGVVLKSIAATLAGGFAALQIAGIAKTILKNFEKESSYNRGTQGSFKLYDNKSKTNGKLLVKFEVSNETDYIQYNSYTKEALGIFGTKSNNSQQAGEALIKFAFHLQNITNQKYEIKTQTMYLFLTDMVDSHIGETLKETLTRARKTTIEQFKKYAPILKEFMPDKIIFIPQLQIETDEYGNEQFGEDIKNLKWKL
jgi:hypothetical protein